MTTMLRLMHAAMSLAVAVRATGQLTPDVSVPAEVFDQTLKLYQITREAMQHGQGREFANGWLHRLLHVELMERACVQPFPQAALCRAYQWRWRVRGWCWWCQCNCGP